MVDEITSTKNRIGRNRGWFFRKLGSKKEGGSQQIGYKLAKLSFKGGATAETNSVEEEPGKMLLKSDEGTGVVQLQVQVVIYEYDNSQTGKSDALVNIYSRTI